MSAAQPQGAGKFERHTAVQPLGDGVFRATLHEDWWIVRGPNGGYLAAIVMRAMEAALADPARSARSLTCHFLRPPQAGEVLIAVTVERSGARVSSLTARMEQEGRLCVLAIAAFGVDFPEIAAYAPPREDVPAAAEVPAIPGSDVAPPLRYQLDFRHVYGPPLFSGADEALVGGWMRMLEPVGADAAALALYADAWIPAPWPRLDRLSPAPTIDLTVHFRAPLPHASLGPEDHVLGRFVSRAASGGYFEEDGVLWAPDGTLLAQSRQLALLL